VDFSQFPLDVIEGAINLEHGSRRLSVIEMWIIPNLLELGSRVRDNNRVLFLVVIIFFIFLFLLLVVTLTLNFFIVAVILFMVIVVTIVFSLWAVCLSVTKVVADASLIVISSVDGVRSLPLDRNALCITIPTLIEVGECVSIPTCREATRQVPTGHRVAILSWQVEIVEELCIIADS
jgi:hypothetical protein